MTEQTLTRKEFLALGLAMAGTSVFGGPTRRQEASIGVCTSWENHAILAKAGCSFIEEGVGKVLMPDKDEQTFSGHLEKTKSELSIGFRSYIYFLPGGFKAVGPEADMQKLVRYASVAFPRCYQSGAKYVVFGSGKARHVPDGFSREEARKQMISLCSALAPVAEKSGIILAVEQLNRGETNFLNTLDETADIVNAVSHPAFRMVCDIYHALKEGDHPDKVLEYGKHIVHCHIAEKEERTPPGVKGDDFRPWFSALKRIRYSGGISIECRWKDLPSEIGPAVMTLKDQYREA